MKNSDYNSWLPTSAKEVRQKGWDELDVIIFTGDAYIDHPSFGASVIGRIIERYGWRVAIVPQPNWRDDLRDFKKLGKPNRFFGVTAGAMDSMVNHYTAARRKRSDDAYTPNGQAGQRPDYASVVYTKILKRLFPDVPVMMGGIEASLRRLTHYDYWSDKLMPGIIAQTEADLLVYGMGEKPLTDILYLLDKGVPFSSLKTVPQTAFLLPKEVSIPKNRRWEDITLHSHEICLNDKKKFSMNFRYIEEESNKWNAARLIQDVGESRIVVNPPYPPMSAGELDSSFDLPFTRLPHPRYHKKGNIPAFKMIQFSVNMHRGCFGGCSFCTISAHQGKFIASRSEESILKEVKQITQMSDFKGYLSDLGGPSANMYMLEGENLDICKQCKRPSCIFPGICPNLKTDHTPMLSVFKKVDSMKEIKKSFIGSGIRYDILLNPNASHKERESHKRYTQEVIEKHVSGRLKVAPEHSSNEVLHLMRKPSFSYFKKFTKEFDRINKNENLNQQLTPYFISSHPGSREEDMAHLAVETHNMNFRLEQVQDFTPTPMTLATVIYYSGIHPYTQKKVYTARSQSEKQQQRIYFFWYKPEYRQKIEAQLRKLKRFDLTSSLFKQSSKNTNKSKSRQRGKNRK